MNTTFQPIRSILELLYSKYNICNYVSECGFIFTFFNRIFSQLHFIHSVTYKINYTIVYNV